MGDRTSAKLPGYSHRRRNIRTVSTTKWERPIPSLKPYWDKICDELEQRKEHVSVSSPSFSPLPHPITNPNVIIINSRDSISSKLNHGVEPIVKISPPTPMRMVTQSYRSIESDNLTVSETGEQNYETDNHRARTSSDLSADRFSPVHVAAKKDAKLYDLSMCMTEMLKNSNVQTDKSCQIHKNSPSLKIFDDNLKRFLPKKKLTRKVNGGEAQMILPPFGSDFSKFHKNKSCPFRSEQISEKPVAFDISLTENRNRVSRPLRKSKTEDFGKKKVKGSFEQFLKVPETPYVPLRSSSRTRSLDKKSKSKSRILKSNLKEMLNIPKLNDVSLDENLTKFNKDTISEEDAAGNSDTETLRYSQAIPDRYNDVSGFPHSRELGASKLETGNLLSAESGPLNENVKPKLTENFKPLSSQFINLPRLSEEINMDPDSPSTANEKEFSCRDKMGTVIRKDEPKKDFLKVPKLGAISSYPSFSKLTSGYNLEMEESQKQVATVSTGIMESERDVENSVQRTESSKRDFLKVPKLSMMSSYPSFNSLIPESLDSDDNTTAGGSELPTSKRRDVNETSSNLSASSNLKSTQNTSITVDEKSANYPESSNQITTRDKDFNLDMNSSLSDRPVKRRKSLKDSVRYAYRALKFMTPNKNLDFQPQSFEPTQKSGLTSSSSDSSQSSKYSKFEPAIKLLTYDDVGKDRPPAPSVSSSSYGSVRSRLRQSASQYLGFDYVLLGSKAKPDTSSTTIPSLTRSTSGPTLDFEEPVFDRPSEKLLNKLPKMSIFPRRKYDKCFACLHDAFKEPVKSIRELPLTTLNAFSKESIDTFTESESSSISLPDVQDFARSQSDYEDNLTDVLRGSKKSPLLDKIEWKSSKGSFRTNIDPHRSRQPLARTSEDSQSLKSDSRIDNLRNKLSAKDSTATNTQSKPMSLSSEHSKPNSSLSGHSSESDEPQVPVKQAAPTTECFVSPYAPLHWVPSLEPLKSLRYRKPVSMHGRAVSITKTEDDSTSDDDANDYRSTRNGTKLQNNVEAVKVTDKAQDNAQEVSSSKSVTKPSLKSSIIKQPSIIAKIISSQSSTVDNLTNIRSRVDLFSGDSKSEHQTTSASDVDTETVEKETEKSPDGEKDSKLTTVDGQSVERSSTKSPLPKITEHFIENGNLMTRDDVENLPADEPQVKRLQIGGEESICGEDVSTEFKENESHVDELRDLAKKTSGIYSNERVIEVLEKCVEEGRTPFGMLEALNEVAMSNEPFTNKEIMTVPEIARSAEVAKNLMKLLINSKKYLNPDTFSPHLEFSSAQTPLCNPRQLRRVLPTKTYNLVARILGMPEKAVTKSEDHEPELITGHQTKDPFKLRQTKNRGPYADSCDMIVHPPSHRGRRRSGVDEDDFEYPQQSPYALFMNKPRRKAINWRPLTERDMLGYDPEATLNMRATRVTNKICQDFCQWLRSLGGTHGEDIDEEVLRDMFQIEFTAEACRSMQVLVKEIPMVPIAVALARNTPGAGELALTRRHLIRDSKAENMPKKVIGFGSMLPRDYRFIPPKNHVDKKWLQCDSVPRDLETMEAVWKGITHLDSVKGFLAWVKAHPGVKLPKILNEAYAKKEALVRQSSAEEAGGLIELEMDQIKSLKVADVE